MKQKKIIFFAILVFILGLSFFVAKYSYVLKKDIQTLSKINSIELAEAKNIEIIIDDSLEIIIGTYLGNFQNNYYGNLAPSSLDVIWKLYLGFGETVVGNQKLVWYGAGWTGQALIVREKNKKYLIHGAFDHHLRKINAENGDVIWKTKFDDVIKGTGTIWENKNAENRDLLILQGSRMGIDKNMNSKIVKSFKAVSYESGNILWEMNSEHTDCWSRDVDASSLIINDTAYITLENGMFTKFNPDNSKAKQKDSINQPEIFSQLQLYTKDDKKKHGKNLVDEASPCLLNGHIYIASGSGHLLGYNLKTQQIDWDLNIGSDIDGSPVVTSDSCLIVTIENQYIEGNGGVFKINPSLKPEKSVIWFFPTQNKTYATWNGGVIGSATVNDSYINDSTIQMATFIGIDGYLYVVAHSEITENKVAGPDGKSVFCLPKLIFKAYVGASISTPIFVERKIIAAGYGGISIFEHDTNYVFTLLDFKPGVFESTPVVDNKKIYISSRDGYLYCFGEVEKKIENLKVDKPKDTAPSSENMNYHIVAGTYQTIDRAEIWNQTLINQGFESRIIQHEKSYYNIVYSAKTYNEALNKLIEIKESGTTQVWILMLK